MYIKEAANYVKIACGMSDFLGDRGSKHRSCIINEFWLICDGAVSHATSVYGRVSDCPALCLQCLADNR
jgi:hypothetical protein